METEIKVSKLEHEELVDLLSTGLYGQGMTYEFLIQDITQCRYKIDNPKNVYLVSGIEVGKGHDNEPLIKEVKILKDLTGQFNTKTDNTEETKTM